MTDLSQQIFGFDAKKKGKINVGWKARHFQCDTGTKVIKYYGSAADIANNKKPKGEINVASIEEANDMLEIKDQKGRVYKLKGISGIYCLALETCCLTVHSFMFRRLREQSSNKVSVPFYRHRGCTLRRSG